MKKKLIFLTAVILFVFILLSFFLSRKMTEIELKNGAENVNIYIPTGTDYNTVLDSLNAHIIIRHPGVFNWLAGKKHYKDLVKPGRYIIDKSQTSIGLINLLRSGKQVPVRVTFSYGRSVSQIAGKIGKLIEADSSDICKFFANESNYSGDGFSKETIISLFIPNTYEMYWNTDPKKLYSRMLKEYNAFWNDERRLSAKGKNLNPVEVSILASILDDEVVKKEEKPRIAGVYLNRLKRGIPLQACPTIKFALNDFTITRILNQYLLVDSPYNTYKHKGFPPGPIGCPTIEGIDAVLKAENHDFLFFVAKPDFSGTHNFSRTLSEHNRYASLYQKELDRRKIFK